MIRNGVKRRLTLNLRAMKGPKRGQVDFFQRGASGVCRIARERAEHAR